MKLKEITRSALDIVLKEKHPNAKRDNQNQKIRRLLQQIEDSKSNVTLEQKEFKSLSKNQINGDSCELCKYSKFHRLNAPICTLVNDLIAPKCECPLRKKRGVTKC